MDSEQGAAERLPLRGGGGSVRLSRLRRQGCSSSTARQGRQMPPGSTICASMAMAKTAINRRDRKNHGFFGPICLPGAPAKI